MSGRREPWPDARRGRAALAALLVVVAAGALVSELRTPWAVDERTYLEMIDGTARHGLPVIDNGPIDEHPALRARWNVAQGGQLWGKYPPLYAYVMAPAYRLGGSRAVIRLNILLLGLLAVGVYDLSQQVTPSPLVAAVAAWLTLTATSVSGMALLISPYVLTSAGVVWSLSLALRTAGSTTASGVLPLAAGLVAGAATACHLLALPVAAVVVVGVGLLGLEQSSAGGGLPRAMSRCSWAAAGLAVPLTAMAVLNHRRFGEVNPVTYGPCPWQICGIRTPGGAEVGSIVTVALPLAVWLLVTVAALWTWRRSAAGSAAVAGIAAAVLFGVAPLEPLAERTVTTVAALFFDVGALGDALSRPYYRVADGLGVLFGPYAVKAMLQSSPVTALALLAVARGRRDRPALLVAIAGVAVLATLILRGVSEVGAHRLGFPFISIRYVSLVAPLLAVLAAAVLARLPWRRLDLVLTVAVAVALAVVLAATASDHGLLRRVLLLRGSLVVGMAAVVLISWSRRRPGSPARGRAAVVGAALTVVVSVGSASGVDLTATAREVAAWDRFTAAVAAATPQRFAIVGYPAQLDPVVSLRQERDLQYGDVLEMGPVNTLARLVRHWQGERRPVFALMPPRPLRTDTYFGLPVVPVVEKVGLYRFVEP